MTISGMGSLVKVLHLNNADIACAGVSDPGVQILDSPRKRHFQPAFTLQREEMTQVNRRPEH